MERLLKGKSSSVGAMAGAVAGLVCITPAAGFVTPGWSILFGVFGAPWCYVSVELLNKLNFVDVARHGHFSPKEGGQIPSCSGSKGLIHRSFQKPAVSRVSGGFLGKVALERSHYIVNKADRPFGRCRAPSECVD